MIQRTAFAAALLLAMVHPVTAQTRRDALNSLIARTGATGRPFTLHEFPGLIRRAPGH